MIEYTKNPEVIQYLEAVKNEIKEKDIQETLLLELYQHMEDSATEQMENGISEEAAWHYALASMGDATETGIALNRVHQKRSPLLPLLVTAISVFIAIFVNTSLIRHHGMLDNNIIYRIYACGIILSLVYFGNHILKKEKLMYALYILLFGFTIISRSHTLLFAIFMLAILILTYWEIKPESPKEQIYKNLSCNFSLYFYILSKYLLQMGSIHKSIPDGKHDCFFLIVKRLFYRKIVCFRNLNYNLCSTQLLH